MKKTVKLVPRAALIRREIAKLTAELPVAIAEKRNLKRRTVLIDANKPLITKFWNTISKYGNQKLFLKKTSFYDPVDQSIVFSFGAEVGAPDLKAKLDLKTGEFVIKNTQERRTKPKKHDNDEFESTVKFFKYVGLRLSRQFGIKSSFTTTVLKHVPEKMTSPGYAPSEGDRGYSATFKKAHDEVCLKLTFDPLQRNFIRNVEKALGQLGVMVSSRSDALTHKA